MNENLLKVNNIVRKPSLITCWIKKILSADVENLNVFSFFRTTTTHFPLHVMEKGKKSEILTMATNERKICATNDELIKFHNKRNPKVKMESLAENFSLLLHAHRVTTVFFWTPVWPRAQFVFDSKTLWRDTSWCWRKDLPPFGFDPIQIKLQNLFSWRKHGWAEQRSSENV